MCEQSSVMWCFSQGAWLFFGYFVCYERVLADVEGRVPFMFFGDKYL